MFLNIINASDNLCRSSMSNLIFEISRGTIRHNNHFYLGKLINRGKKLFMLIEAPLSGEFTPGRSQILVRSLNGFPSFVLIHESVGCK